MIFQPKSIKIEADIVSSNLIVRKKNVLKIKDE